MKKYDIPKPIIDSLNNLNNLTTDTSNPTIANDLISSHCFLKQYDGNKATFEAYRREIERLLQWASLVAKKSVLELNREHIKEYIEFCLNPPLSWIGITRVPRFIERHGTRLPNPRWRPFVATVSKQDYKTGKKPDKKKYSLSQKAMQEIFTVLGSFYNFLLLEDKVQMNPVVLIRQKSRYIQKQQTKATVKRLTETQWQCCLKTAETLANNNPDRHERTLFIISALYLLYLRISELVSTDRWVPQMKHFYQDSNQTWWFQTLGKGNKLRDIAVSDDMLIALARYREQRKMTSLPSPSDSSPLLPKEKGKGAITSTRHIRSIV